MAHPSEPYIDAQTLGEILSVSPLTIRRWVKARRIPYFRLPSGLLRFRLSSVQSSLTQTTALLEHEYKNRTFGTKSKRRTVQERAELIARDYNRELNGTLDASAEALGRRGRSLDPDQGTPHPSPTDPSADSGHPEGEHHDVDTVVPGEVDAWVAGLSSGEIDG